MYVHPDQRGLVNESDSSTKGKKKREEIQTWDEEVRGAKTVRFPQLVRQLLSQGLDGGLLGGDSRSARASGGQEGRVERTLETLYAAFPLSSNETQTRVSKQKNCVKDGKRTYGGQVMPEVVDRGRSNIPSVEQGEDRRGLTLLGARHNHDRRILLVHHCCQNIGDCQSEVEGRKGEENALYGTKICVPLMTPKRLISSTVLQALSDLSKVFAEGEPIAALSIKTCERARTVQGFQISLLEANSKTIKKDGDGR